MATDAWAPPLDAAHVAALRAVRIAVVARSAAPRDARPWPTAPATPRPQRRPRGPGDRRSILSADPDWQCYRYKTLLLTIPLKNMIFGGQT